MLFSGSVRGGRRTLPTYVYRGIMNRKEKDQRIAERVVKRQISSDDMMPDHSPDLDSKPRKMKIVDPISDQVADSKYYIRNWKWNGAQDDFPQEPWLRCTDKFYPRSQFGPIAIDEPRNEIDILKSERKKKFLKEKGIRFLITTKVVKDKEHKRIVEKTYDELLLELKEVENELDSGSNRAQTAS